ncbi:MAG: hypothetical protein ACLQDY_27845 [Streptosporangiaceae bacterium]
MPKTLRYGTRQRDSSSGQGGRAHRSDRGLPPVPDGTVMVTELSDDEVAVVNV